jgi:hypothetical protein
LARAHEVLRQIAEGLVNPRELPENVDLLSRAGPLDTEGRTVVHPSLGPGGYPRSAA